MNKFRDKRFKVLTNIPKEALSGMHPDTKKIIEQIRLTKGKVLACDLKDTREAKNRLDALRRARGNGHVKYKQAYRHGGTLYFRVR